MYLIYGRNFTSMSVTPILRPFMMKAKTTGESHTKLCGNLIKQLKLKY